MNHVICNGCHGDCCRLYDSEQGTKHPDVYFDEWCEDWGAEFERIKNQMGRLGLEVPVPTHDPLITHQHVEVEARFDLWVNGVDFRSCQYRGKTGCMFPRELRPRACLDYKCKNPDFFVVKHDEEVQYI